MKKLIENIAVTFTFVFLFNQSFVATYLNIYPGEGETLRAEKIACFVKQLETQVLLIRQLQLFTSIF